jgi:hypothetical protein
MIEILKADLTRSAIADFRPSFRGTGGTPDTLLGLSSTRVQRAQSTVPARR